MKNIPTKEEYVKASERMEEILKLDLAWNEIPKDNPTLIELDKVSDIVITYEESSVRLKNRNRFEII